MSAARLRRRALLGAGPAYAAGLALHLDGIDNAGTGAHDSSYKNWVDAAGGRTFTQKPSGSEIAFAANHFPFNGANCFYTSLGGKTDWGTIEIVFENDGNSATQMIFKSSSTTYFATVSEKSGAIAFATGGSKSVTRRAGVHTYACNGTDVFVDGVKKTAANVSISWSKGGWGIGAYESNSYFCTGKLYAVRGYDRVLTDAEIANNAAVDAARFGIEVTA